MAYHLRLRPRPDVILGVVDRVLGGLPSFTCRRALLGGVTNRAVRDNVGRIIRSTGTQQTAKQGARFGQPFADDRRRV